MTERKFIRALRDRDAEIVRLRAEIRALDVANAEVCDHLDQRDAEITRLKAAQPAGPP